MYNFLLWMENMFALCERRINIGINDQASKQTRHGVLWVVADIDNQKCNVRAPIIIDKPHLVRSGLNYATWKRVKDQIEKMGINATHIELKFGESGHFCYQLDVYKELYAHGCGKPLCYEPKYV